MSNKFELEKKLQELDVILESLESDNKSINDQLVDFENGLKIIKECREFLENTEQKIINLTSE